ncbi:hypothetical protein COU53_01845 [Candidatus Pacearchaeota archaeon CG10_big_fil_rev_8_21_14_0_10_30_48]|nr:MAG: hypothetical protein COU53_01845 [Candidatus Pacearchaeota archaeon CG10_big_fil_rev_8_21_14_0_10_30_48]
MRYEFTFQLKRLARNKKLPYKRYQIGPVFRDEPISGNRMRQFISCDGDVIGADIKDQAEVLSMTKEILDKLKVNGEIYVNNRKLLNEILDEQKVLDKNSVIREIDKLDKLSESEVKTNLKKYKAEGIISIFKKPEIYFKKYSSYKEIVELKKYCKYFGVNVKFLPSLARGLGYYDGNIFEIKTKKIKETIFGGGAYTFNDFPSFGFGVSIERLVAVSTIEINDFPVLVISIEKDKEAVELIKALREKKIACSLFYGKPGKGLEYANSKNFEKVIFVGEKETKLKKFTLKDLKSGKEDKLNLKELAKKLV